MRRVEEKRIVVVTTPVPVTGAARCEGPPPLPGRCEQDPWGCRRRAVSGFLSAPGTEQRKVWLFCGVEHTHSCAAPLDVLVHQLMGSPRVVNEPFPPCVDANGCPPEKLPLADPV